MTNKSFCPAAWNSIYIQPDGVVDNCCISRNHIGNINTTNNVNEIILGPKNIEIQQAMINGDEVPGCKACHNKTHSFRDGLIEKFKIGIEQDQYSTPGQFKLEYLDARWSNTCNLACVYCSPVLSSMWAQQEKSYHRIESNVKNNLLEYVLDNVSSLKYVYLAGGEPLLMKENKQLIAAIAEQNPTCRVLVNSNISEIDGNEIYENLIKLTKCEWLISIDTVGKTYEYMRWPANWNTFYSNLMKIKSLVGPEKMGFNMVLTNINGLSIWDAVDLLLDSGFVDNRISLLLYNNGAFDGPWDIRYMPIEYQKKILERMDKPSYKNLLGWQNVFDYISQLVYNKSDWPWKMLDQLDKSRNLNSRTIFPELYIYKDTQ